MGKIKNWTIVREDAWRNDESGVIVEVMDLSKISNYSGYGFGFWDGKIDKFRGIEGGFFDTNKSEVRKKAIRWLKVHPYIQKNL